MFFSLLDWGFKCLRKTITGVKCPSPHIIARAHTININVSEDAILHINLNIVFTNVFHSKVDFPPSQTLFFRSQSVSAAHTHGQSWGRRDRFNIFLKNLSRYVFIFYLLSKRDALIQEDVGMEESREEIEIGEEKVRY